MMGRLILNWRKWALFGGLGLLALGAIGGAAYWGYLSSKPQKPQTVETPPLVDVSRGDVQLTVTAPGNAVAGLEMALTAGVGARLEECLVRPGDAVKAGQELARFGEREKFEQALNLAKAELDKAKQTLSQLTQKAPLETAKAQKALIEAQSKFDEAQKISESMKYPRAGQTRLESAYADYQNALTDVALAQQRYDETAALNQNDSRRTLAITTLTEAQKRRDQTLATYNWLSGKPTTQNIQEAEAKLSIADAELKDAQQAWERLKDGPDKQSMAMAQLDVAQHQAEVTQAQSNLDSLTVKAPFDGVVTEVKARAGQAVAAGAELFTLSDPRKMEVLATVVEEDLPLVKAGQPVKLFFDAMADLAVTGKVERIVPRRSTGDRTTYPVYFSLDQVPEHLMPGMTSDGSIVIEQRKNVLRLPRSVVKAASNNKTTVEVWNGANTEKRSVEVGLRGDTFVEILSGLLEGDRVVAR